ncbi:response regulator [Zooshikella harenae]|uniref:Response regulator n=1 Tax=Zooshikella harenae TaxID=2827238 RepID=A0ABS5ZDG7_9GAMM|nr:response regulator [Zooshikella harenae]MBU2712034.1 response regulator [Zooshikella harenae]
MLPENAAILLIDDEADMCWAVKRILTGKGYQVTMVDTGIQAMEQVQCKHYPLIFLDAKLPDVEGLQLAERIKQIFPDTHIIFLTGYYYRDDPVITTALSKGIIDGFIAKPFRNEDVLNALIY